MTGLAAGDFSDIVPALVAAGYAVSEPAAGILQVLQEPIWPSWLLSVGVHGDETAPIELLASVLDELLRQPQQLAVNLLIVVGNIAAIGQARRYIDTDLNRLFHSGTETNIARHGAPCANVEAERADAIMAASSAYFAQAHGERWHLDLHTAIRTSLYPRFALVPAVIVADQQQALFNLLGHAGIDAVILNRSAAGTFSTYTANRLDATSATVELGQVSALGSNDVGEFADAAATLGWVLRGGTLTLAPSLPQVFTVVQELVKRSEAFRMAFDGATPNFTALAPGALIASDGAQEYRVGPEEELVVFPNPAVQVGLRAGLMVVRSCE